MLKKWLCTFLLCPLMAFPSTGYSELLITVNTNKISAPTREKLANRCYWNATLNNTATSAVALLAVAVSVSGIAFMKSNHATPRDPDAGLKAGLVSISVGAITAPVAIKIFMDNPCELMDYVDEVELSINGPQTRAMKVWASENYFTYESVEAAIIQSIEATGSCMYRKMENTIKCVDEEILNKGN